MMCVPMKCGGRWLCDVCAYEVWWEVVIDVCAYEVWWEVVV